MGKIHLHEVGTSEYPIPIMKDDKIEWLASDDTSVFLPTMREDTTEEFYGRLIRNVLSDPSMMDAFQEILYRFNVTDVDESGEIINNSKSYNLTVEGAPSSGKTYLAKAFGELMHPKGAFVINCEAIEDPDELFKTTTYNVAQKAKTGIINTHLLKLAKKGESLKPETIQYLQKMLKDAVSVEEREITKNDESKVIQVVSIDWEGALNAGITSDYISSICDDVIDMEGIKYTEQQSSIGFTTSNGPLLKALLNENDPDYGRMVILDESNRIPQIDAWLQIKAFLSDENVKTLKLKGEDDVEYTIKRNNLPASFFCVSTCNEATEEMGLSAKELTKPMISREGANIDIRKISDPQQRDFFSRTLKHLTGVPVYYEYMSRKEYYDENPNELAQKMLRLRTIGLTKEEIKQIPEEEIFNIEHIDRTIKVAEGIASFLYQSNLIIKQRAQDESLPQRYQDYLKNRALIDLRYVYKLIQSSKDYAKRLAISGGKSLETSSQEQTEAPKETSSQEQTEAPKEISSQEQTEAPKETSSQEQTKAPKTSEQKIKEKIRKRAEKQRRNYMFERGSALDYLMFERVVNLVRPDNVGAYIESDEDMTEINATYEAIKQVAKDSKFATAMGGEPTEDSIAMLYNAKESDFPNVSLEAIIGVIKESFIEIYGHIEKADILDDDVLNSVLQQISANRENNEVINNIAVPNLDKDTITDAPILTVSTNTSTLGEAKDIDPKSLITTEQFVDSLIIKQLFDYNMKKLESETIEIDGESNNASKIANGENTIFFTTSVVMQNKGQGQNQEENEGQEGQNQDQGQNQEENKGPEGKTSLSKAHIVYNKKTGQTIVLADFNPSENDRKRMQNANIAFVNYTKATKEDYEKIAAFLIGQVKYAKDLEGNASASVSDLLNGILLRANPAFADVDYEGELEDYEKSKESGESKDNPIATFMQLLSQTEYSEGENSKVVVLTNTEYKTAKKIGLFEGALGIGR